MNTGKVTRLEVIGPEGRVLTELGVHVTLQLQDDGRTLKVFFGQREEEFIWDRSNR